ncbi:MAG: efflux RND transporter periplasmic adaptor subunit [Vicinamibacterales bacterium]
MKRIQSWLLAAAVVAAVSAGGCAGGSAGKTAVNAEKPPVAVGVGRVVSADLVDGIDVVGSLSPKFSADIKSEISGIVQEVYVTQWVPVRKGDRLARLDTTETQAAIDALKATEAQVRVAETRARREYERAQQLREYGLITPQSLDDARSALDAAVAASAAAAAQVRAGEARLGKALIRAPMDGVVALRSVNVGDRVENMGGTPLFVIVDNRLLDLTVTVPSTRMAEVRTGQTIEFTTDALPGRSFSGRVMFINPAVDEASRSGKVVAEVSNRDFSLKGGFFVKGRIVLSSRPNVLQVPREALINWDVARRTAEAFVVKNGQAEKRVIQLGMANGRSVEVLSGLAADDQVVTRGGFALRQGDKVTVTESGEGA